jgi:hypothetical protein
MRKYLPGVIILAVAVVMLMAGLAHAGGWTYARPNNGTTRNFDSLHCVTTTPDTSVHFWFVDVNSALAIVWMQHQAKNAALSTLKIPLVQYKYIGGDGNYFGTDSTVAGAWNTLSDSSHLSITAGNKVYQMKVLPDYRGAPRIVFKATSTAESTKTYIRVSGSK